MSGLLVLEVRRALRDPRYLLIAVCMPVGMYLLFSGLFGSHGERAQGLPQPVELMVAMVAYGAMWSVLSATGPRIANERAIGWSQQLRLTPLGEAGAVGAKLVAALLVALPAMILVCVTAALSHHVRLPASEWVVMLAVMWLGTTPLALLGMAIGRFVNADAAFGISMALYFVLGALGGLWMPLSTMPHVMQQIATFLPSNGVAVLGWRAVGGHGSIVSSLVVLAAWSAVCGVLAVARRPARIPSTRVQARTAATRIEISP